MPALQDARKNLAALGMTKNVAVSNRAREYWYFNDGTDVFYDHSATISKYRGQIFVSDFSDKRKI